MINKIRKALISFLMKDNNFPVIYRHKGGWILLDVYHQVFEIKYTGRVEYPLEITLIKR